MFAVNFIVWLRNKSVSVIPYNSIRPVLRVIGLFYKEYVFMCNC